VQGDPSPGSGAGDLFQPETQATAGIALIFAGKGILIFQALHKEEKSAWHVSQV
jgi:hypothetical protein